jgi:ribose transport system ATP-binding protein
MALMTESRRDDGLLMAASAAENLALVWPQLARPDDIAAEVQLHCASLDRQPVAELSGGNQQKVALGKWLAAVPKAMILDEPTRGIDVGARQEIYRILHRLAAAGVALLVISSEIEELTGICDRILVMRRGSIAAVFDRGNYHREAILEQAI